MTDLEQRLRSLADQPVPEPTGVEELAKRARNLRRKRWSLRAGGGLLGVVLLAGAVLSVAGVIAPPPSVVFGPGSDRPAVAVPEGWQTTRIGAAAFSVPGDWPVTEVGMPGPIPHPEHIFRSGPGVYVADRLHQPPGPPAQADAPPRSAGIYALPAHGDPEHARWLADEGTPVTINQQEGLWAATEEFRWYAFPDLDLLLWVSYDPEPALMDQVLATVRPADSTAAVNEPPQDDQEGVVRADTPDGDAAMELVVDRSVVGPGQQVGFRLVNRGQVTLLTGMPFEVERWDGYTWRTVPVDVIWASIGWELGPDEPSERQQWPTNGRPEPGWYRIVKSASYDDLLDPGHELEARARFRVAGPAAQTPPEPSIRDERLQEELAWSEGQFRFSPPADEAEPRLSSQEALARAQAEGMPAAATQAPDVATSSETFLASYMQAGGDDVIASVPLAWVFVFHEVTESAGGPVGAAPVGPFNQDVIVIIDADTGTMVSVLSVPPRR